MDNNFLTRIEKAGGSGVLARSATYSDRKALSLHLAGLKAAGHAIVAAEIIENGEPNGEMIITHYSSCRACESIK